VRKDGSIVAGVSLVERTLTRFAGIAQMQLIQENVDELLVNIVEDADYGPETETGLIDELKRSVGEHNTIRIEFVARIPQERSGKYRFAISKVQNPYSA
jgi:phenylacetate-CoA ligase